MVLLNSSSYKKTSQHYYQYYGLEKISPDQKGLEQILISFQKLPYENVSKLLNYSLHKGREQDGIRLPDEVWHDFIHDGMGGTCYSLTFFLQTLLENKGFICYPLSCDMRWGKNVHCCLAVVLDNRFWLCDPGYLLTKPMELTNQDNKIYKTEHSGVWLRWNNKYELFTFNGNDTRWRYSFENKSCERDKFLSYWLASFEQPSMRGICLTRQKKGGMVYFHNNYYREVTPGNIKKGRLGKNWLDEIKREFGISKRKLKRAYCISQEELL